MTKVFKNRTIKKGDSSIRKLVVLKRDTKSNKGVEFAGHSVCPVDDAKKQKLLEYCHERIALTYAEWERNSKEDPK